MIKRLIFDIDGTLITGVNFKTAITNALNKISIYEEDIIDKYVSSIKTYEENYDNYNKEDYLNHMSKEIGVNLPDNFLDIFFNELKYLVPDNNKDIINTIDELSKYYELVILTNYFKVSQMNRLNTMNIGHYFKECFGEELIKPNKDSYLNACGNYLPNECVMIGDDINLDIISAKENGLKTIFVNTKGITTNVETIIVDKVTDITKNMIEEVYND